MYQRIWQHEVPERPSAVYGMERSNISTSKMW